MRQKAGSGLKGVMKSAGCAGYTINRCHIKSSNQEANGSIILPSEYKEFGGKLLYRKTLARSKHQSGAFWAIELAPSNSFV